MSSHPPNPTSTQPGTPQLKLRTVLSWIFMALALAMLVAAVFRQWDQFSAAAAQLSWASLLGAFVVALLGLLCMFMSWRHAIAATSRKIPLTDAANTFFVSQLGKYIPGAVWPIVAQMELNSKYGISRLASALASILSMVIGISTAIVLGVFGILVSGQSLAQYWWLIPVALLCVLTLVPTVLRFWLRLAGTLVKRLQPLVEIPIYGTHILKAAGWAALCWVLYGMHAWIILGSFAGRYDLWWYAFGAYALAYAVGFLIIIAPGGIGPREAALIAFLGTVIAPSSALAFAIVSRLLMTLIDVFAAGGAHLIWRIKNRKFRQRDSRIPAQSSP